MKNRHLNQSLLWRGFGEFSTYLSPKLSTAFVGNFITRITPRYFAHLNDRFLVKSPRTAPSWRNLADSLKMALSMPTLEA